MKKLFSLILFAFIMFNVNAQPTKKQWVNSKLKELTLRQQIAQLFVISCYPQRGEEYIERVAKIIHDEQIGGLIWGECTPTQCINALNKMQSQVNIPMLVTIDAEWGVSMRLDSVVKFPQQLALGAIRDNSLIYEMGKEVARECGEIGTHFNFAPVVDVNNNSNNPVINMRSFGENKYKVTEKAYQYMSGMQDHGLLTTLKHFPGHGDTEKDSHKELPAILHDKKRIDDVELYPFRELIKRGAKGVMTAHLNVPTLDDTEDVASQSYKICTELLQKKLKFKGLVVTDGLEMRAASHNRDTAKVAMYSLKAGNDILEIPIDMKKSIDEIVKAVERGEISEKYIRKKCKKILETKYDLGLHNGYTPINPDGILDRLNTPEKKQLREKIANAVLTLIENKSALPVKSPSINYIELGKEKGKTFEVELQKSCSVAKYVVDFENIDKSIDSVKSDIDNKNLIVVGYHNTHPRPQRNFGMDSTANKFIESLTETNKVVLVYFGNPYAIAKLKSAEKFAAILIAYDNSDEAQSAAARAIFGKTKIDGKLPVTINEKYKEDFGIEFLP